MPNKVVDIFNHTVGHKGFDYSKINEEIYIGTSMCCQFGFKKELLSKGIRADISLEEERVDTPNGVDFFLWLPTIDNEPPAKDKMDLGIKAIEFFVERNIKVYIHCKNGHGRAPTLFMAYLIKKGMSFDQAFEYLKEKRSSIHLTASQVKMLQSLE